LGLFSNTVADGTPLLAKLDQTIVDLGFAQYTAQKTNTLNLVLYTFSLMIGTAGLPHVIIRFFTVPKVKDARSSAGWALVFISLLYTTAPAVGAMAMLNLASTVQPGPVAAADGSLEYEARPQWFKNWEKTGLLTFEDKNGNGRVEYRKGDTNELKVDRDIMVLANPEIAQLPNWVIALVAAGGLAAALSTAAGLLLAIASAISHDMLKGIFNPQITEKGELLAARISMAGAIAVAGYFGLHPPGFAAQVVALAFGLAASSIFPALMMGIFNKRMNNSGAVVGMLVGITSTLVYIFWFKGWFFISGTAMAANTPDNWFLGISPEAFGAVGALLNFASAILVSKVTQAPPEHIQHMVEDIRIPKGSGAATGH
ncbi:MAG: VC_2705 family sodium/solute symporter, partial [Sedimenticola sp.]|nr:VC_2705 family sodium/solute symporter [Sedimenticola sp.]